jgi:AGZA family xanthine/uracil permease-like MFS transporter
MWKLLRSFLVPFIDVRTDLVTRYFTFTVVGYHGSGLVPYEVALTAVFVEGFVFVGLTLIGLRQWLARAIPHSIKLATGVGIGLYLTIIGLT